MKYIYDLIKYIFIVFVGVSALIMLPQILVIAILIPPIYYLANKLSYKNVHSSVFGIDKNNSISSKLGKNVVLSSLSKDKNDYLKAELANVIVDMNEYTEYKIVSDTKIKRALNKLQKEGYISDFNVTELSNENFVSNFVSNLATGNFNSILTRKTNYDMSFTRTDKEITHSIYDALYVNVDNIKVNASLPIEEVEPMPNLVTLEQEPKNERLNELLVLKAQLLAKKELTYENDRLLINDKQKTKKKVA